MTIYILYSADYELFLGGNYCDEREVLIDPTQDLLTLCDDLKVPVTLFADIFSLLRYKELDLVRFPDAAENQLRDAIRRGHDVQSHVHPHWKYTLIDGSRYTVNAEYYLLGNQDTNTEALYAKILDYLTTSRDYLDTLLQPVHAGYHCIAFRAGGYGLQPNPDIILKSLHDAGYRIDSSIVPGFMQKSHVNNVDFSMVPRTPNYYLNADLRTPSNSKQGIFEIPIASCTFGIIENSIFQMNVLLAFLKNTLRGRKVLVSQHTAKGYTIHQDAGNQKQTTAEYEKYHDFLKSFFNRFYYLDGTANDEKMFQCTKKYLSGFDFIHEDVFFSFNMHPKTMERENFEALKKYHTKLKMYYQDNIQAIHFQQAAEMIMREP